MVAVEMTRRRSRRVLPLTVVLLVVLTFGASVLPAASYSAANVDRGLSAGVADDSDAVLGLTIVENVTVGTTTRLVVVTNNLGSDATVTVSLASDSAAKGDLSANGQTGDELSVALAAGNSLTVDVTVANESANVGTDLVFHVTADGVGISATVDGRRTTITDSP